jgi:xanthine/CO dehydrogenase XdhC/CoxF family maturation factor
MVIDRARQVLRDGGHADSLDIPLGPEIGQCCGGRVDVALPARPSLRGERLLVKRKNWIFLRAQQISALLYQRQFVNQEEPSS